MLIDAMPDLTAWLTNLGDWGDPTQGLFWHISFDWTVVAQKFNQDVMADIQKAFNGFIKSGQVWALIIGIIIGYLFKSFTTFG